MLGILFSAIVLVVTMILAARRHNLDTWSESSRKLRELSQNTWQRGSRRGKQ